MSRSRRASLAERRARRLIALYPCQWRERYGEEFTALIVDEIAECPRSPRRTLNVVRCAFREQLGSSGASGDRAAPLTRLRAATAITALASAPFLLLALAICLLAGAPIARDRLIS